MRTKFIHIPPGFPTPEWLNQIVRSAYECSRCEKLSYFNFRQRYDLVEGKNLKCTCGGLMRLVELSYDDWNS